MLEVTFKRIVNKICLSKGSQKLAVARRQRTPSCMDECFDKPEERRDIFKPVLVIFLLLPAVYYMFYYKSNSESSNTGIFSQTILTDPLEIVTEDGQKVIVTNISNEHNMDKIFTIVTHVKKSSRNVKFKHVQHVNEQLPPCTMKITGNVTVCKELNKSVDLNYLFPMIDMGGHYVPDDCHPRHKVAILVPYRDREENLKIFLYNIHPFLMRQKLEYRIFVFEQFGKELFNKGRLFNAGFLEIQKNDDWQCVIFHDVDLLPTTDKISYTCPILPRHMCASVVEKERLPTYKTIFGGVTAMTMYHFRKTNGYSNLYWGWGGEDNDMYKRIHAVGLGVTRYSKNIGRYISLQHSSRPVNTKRYMLLATAEDRFKTDGLSNLRYQVKSYASKPLYTHIVIDVETPVLPDYITESTFTLVL